MSRASREYEQTVRAEAAAETRLRVIEVTRAVLSRLPLVNVSLPEIAQEAGVARSTIYAAFGSRAGLLEAVAEDSLLRGGFDELGKAFRHTDAVKALEASLQAAGRMYAREHPVGRAMLALAAVDKDAAQGAARYELGRMDGMRHLAARLRAQGYLRDDVTDDEAVDVLWVITSFETYDQLFTGRGLTPEEASARLIAMVKRSISTV